MEARSRAEHTYLMAEILKHRQDAIRVDEGLRQVKDQVSKTRADLKQRIESVDDTVVSVQNRVQNIQNIGEQILAFLGSFPSEFRALLRNMTQMDFRIYNILLEVQRDIAAAPTNILQSNIRFEDALGRGRELPYEFFRRWEVSSHGLQCSEFLANLRY